MGQPNESLREARLRTASRRAPGEPMSRSELASAVSSWLWRETGKRHDLDPHLLAKWERGAVRRPSGPYRAALRAVLGASSDAELGFVPTRSAADEVPVEPAEAVLDPIGPGSADGGPPADADFVASLRGAIAQFVRMDSLLGSGEVVDAVVRRFRDAQRVLASGRYRVEVERDLEAATAELGEVAGWMLIDAQRHDEARLINSEALMLAQIAGDTSMQWFILSNQALAGTYSGRQREALRISERFGEEPRVPIRVRALFRLRQARALGHLGDESAARSAFDRARATFGDGVSNRDPAWAWWFNARELDGHAGSMYASLGRHAEALPLLSSAVDLAAGRESQRWALYIHRACLLDSALAAGAVAEAERAAIAVAPMLGQMHSVRTENRLRRAVARGPGEALPSTLSDVLDHIRHRLPPR
ncbi:hypothetical protein OOZ19_26730 [Saccharopolyspora sp. NFXS83]|uniref:hypothetical protein n=1 Tax=Saccharopolyspora sp. NFXS83 TaxID=2993560 RepID=UPI00224A83BE|nr:hypothetical protein [Saccharopolyspora sp. NFXS83]MCX2733856.1 hypothetical protein [Saccharopolyspora sp. NFXS83]